MPIKQKQTFYYCQFYDLPVFDQDVHLIRYDILINKESRDLVHHIVVHQCDRSILRNGTIGAECGAVNTPGDMGTCLSSTIVVAWVCLFCLFKINYINKMFKLN